MIPKTAFYSPHLFCRDTSVFIIMNIRIIIIIPKSSASNLDLCPDSSQDPFRDSPQDIPRSSQYELDLELRLELLRARSRAPFRARIRALRSSISSSDELHFELQSDPPPERFPHGMEARNRLRTDSEQTPNRFFLKPYWQLYPPLRSMCNNPRLKSWGKKKAGGEWQNWAR